MPHVSSLQLIVLRLFDCSLHPWLAGKYNIAHFKFANIKIMCFGCKTQNIIPAFISGYTVKYM